MKQFCVFLLYCIFALASHAQRYWVMGQIADEFTYEPLDSVTVRFLRPDSTEVERIVSRDDRMNDRSFGDYISAPGKYILHFSKRGYEDTYKTVNFRYRKYRIMGVTFVRARADEEAADSDGAQPARSRRDCHQDKDGDERRHHTVQCRCLPAAYRLDAKMQTESYRNVLRRYVMFNLSFRLREVL